MARGSRKPYGLRWQRERINTHRVTWVNTFLGLFAWNLYPYEARLEYSQKNSGKEVVLEYGDEVILEIPGKGDIYTALDLTKLTGEELDYVETVITEAIQAARPVCARRDKDAIDAREAGIDTLERQYRQIPKFVTRKRDE